VNARAVVEQALGRDLLPDEEVHHVNRNRSDNRLENLVVLDAREHVLLHARESLEGLPPIGRALRSCRLAARLTAAEVAARLGCSLATVYRWEWETTRITVDQLGRFADALGLTYRQVAEELPR